MIEFKIYAQISNFVESDYRLKMPIHAILPYL